MAVILGYDSTTLREIVDVDAARTRLADLGDQRSTLALGEKVGLLRVLGRLDEAFDTANEALRLARLGGDREALLLARLRRAQVLQFRGELDKALIELDDCVTESQARDWVRVEGYALQHRGKVRFDRDELAEALRDFKDALTVRVRNHAPSDEIDATMLAIHVVETRLGEQPEPDYSLTVPLTGPIPTRRPAPPAEEDGRD